MYNKVFLIGNLTRDPDMRYTGSGIPVARFAIAVKRVKRKGVGAQEASEEKNDVDFINCVAWRRLAEICGEYLRKGRSIAVEGRLQIRTFEKAGEKRTVAEVLVDNMQMLGKKPETEGAPPPEIKTEESKLPSEEVPFEWLKSIKKKRKSL